MRLDFKEIEEHLDMEFFLERESVPYRESRGVNGMQLNIKTCPNCGDKRYRTYFGLESGRGNCFVCNTGFNKASFIHAYLDTGVWSDTLRHCGELLKEQGWRPKRKQMVIVEPGEVKLPHSASLPLNTGENLQYLIHRGFNDDITRYFNLRWCEYGWWLRIPENHRNLITNDYSEAKELTSLTSQIEQVDMAAIYANHPLYGRF